MSLMSVYESPFLYESSNSPSLAGFNFHVTDASTALPIQNAYCKIHAALDGKGDTDGGYTDANGVFGIDAKWFVPRSWSVSKEGYLRQAQNGVPTQINVALEPTTVIYTVRIFAGSGGSTVPSGTIQVEPTTELLVTAYPDPNYFFDYWMYKGQNVGSDNPLKFLIDRDAITITAIFKTTPTPPTPPPTDTLIETYRGIDIMRDTETSNIYFHYGGLRYEFSSNTPIITVRAKIDELLVVPPPPNGNGPPPPPNGNGWVVTKPVHIFDDFELTSESTQIFANASRKIGKVDMDVLTGGKLEYSIVYTKGNTIPKPNVRIFFNDVELVSEAIALNQTANGSIDLTGLIQKSNTIKLQVESTILLWAETFFDVWVTFGYSEEPDTDPNVPFNWEEIIDRYGKGIALVALGVGVIWFVTRRPAQPQIIVVGGK